MENKDEKKELKDNDKEKEKMKNEKDDDSKKEEGQNDESERSEEDWFEKYQEKLKFGPKDGSEEEKIPKVKERDEVETDEEESEKEKARISEDERFEKEIEEAEKKRKEREEKRKKELERIYEAARKRKEREEKSTKKEEILGGVVTKVGKVFSHESKEGVFRRKKLKNLETGGIKKMEKALKKVHRVPLKKKLEFINALKIYNTYNSSGKTVLRKEALEEFARKVRSKDYSGTKFRRMRKKLDPRTLKFKKKEIDKIVRKLTGKEDPNKYVRRKTKSAVNKPRKKSVARRGLF